jgi:RsiW-degrading membrane proteinase PrsW (M82 family)
MSSRVDPLTRVADESQDLQGISTWEPRSTVDRLLANYAWATLRVTVILIGLGLFLLSMLLVGVQLVLRPGGVLAIALFPVSVIPALLIGGYVWYTDITREPVLYLIVTFLLGIVFSTFPLVTNTVSSALLAGSIDGSPVEGLIQASYFLFLVAPMEELAKLGAVFAFVYWTDRFDTVIDGAVYGAVAGLGFATIENFIYIAQVLGTASNVTELFLGATIITTVRSLVAPGHVIWTALAGYYLGLAKFNREYAFPLVVKGLFIVILLHGVYNTVSGVFSGFLVFPFIVAYHGITLGYLFGILRRYRKAYADASPGDHAAPVSELGRSDDTTTMDGDTSAWDEKTGAAAQGDASPNPDDGWTGNEPGGKDGEE